MKCAVIGHPLRHSLSPVIHTYWLRRHGIEGTFGAVDVPAEELHNQLPAMIADDYTGFSVTMPHKQSVMGFCDTVDETARRIGAVNTLSIGNKGHITGFNTDWFGFIENIREAAPDHDFAAKPVLVLGAGGAARAVIYGLQQAGARRITLCNRTHETAIALAREFGVGSAPWEERAAIAAPAGLLVNTTALGMIGQDMLNFDIAFLPASAVVCDIVYKPLETRLLKDARARGLRAVDGLGMLIHQARLQFERWTGIRPDATPALRQAILDHLKR